MWLLLCYSFEVFFLASSLGLYFETALISFNAFSQKTSPSPPPPTPTPSFPQDFFRIL